MMPLKETDNCFIPQVHITLKAGFVEVPQGPTSEALLSLLTVLPLYLGGTFVDLATSGLVLVT